MSEDVLAKLRAANPKMAIKHISDPSFTRFGRYLPQYDASEMVARTEAIVPKTDRVAYETSVKALEEPSALNTALIQEVYGGMDTQIGWCYGHNSSLNGVEYHRGTEINVCVTDCVFLMGHVQDVEFGEEIRYDTADVRAFYAPRGSVIEFSPWNLHMAPIHVHEGEQFCALVYLPRGTNEKLPFAVPQVGENRLLRAVNKWMMGHPSLERMIQFGVYPGLVGENPTVKAI
jgi:hypothetical protein